MKAAVLIAVRDLRQRLRDRSAIVLAFIGPFILAAIIGFAFGDDNESFKLRLGVVDLDGGAIGQGFLEALEQLPQETFQIMRVDSEPEVRALIEQEELGAAFVIPEGFTEAIGAGEGTTLRVIRGAGAPVSSEIASGIADGFSAEIEAGNLAVRTAVAAGALREGGDITGLVEEAAAGRVPVTVVDGSLSSEPINMASYFAPGMAIFFLFFTVQAAPLSILLERRQGTLARMAAAPLKPAQILGGKFLSAFVLGMISLIVLAVTTSVFLGAGWGRPDAALALGAATVFAAMGITALTSFSARSEESAGGVGSIVAVVLALLGGSFFPVNEAPEFIQTLSLGTPHGWALRGFIDLVATGGGISEITTNIGVLVAIGATTGAAALALSRRLVRL